MMKSAETSIKIHLIVVAAGIGSRFSKPANKLTQPHPPKQYALIGNQSVLEHSIMAFDEIDIDDITVVIHPDDTYWQHLNIKSNHAINNTVGGAQRHDSVRNGLKSIQAAPQDWVLVHDAARPCVTPDEINSLINCCLNQQQGGLLVRPLTDTIKHSHDGNQVNKTINRNQLYAALTPQMFRCGELLKSLTVFEADSITDESSAMESQGQQPLMVMGQSSNIKITEIFDLTIAECILRQQGRIK